MTCRKSRASARAAPVRTATAGADPGSTPAYAVTTVPPPRPRRVVTNPESRRRRSPRASVLRRRRGARRVRARAAAPWPSVNTQADRRRQLLDRHLEGGATGRAQDDLGQGRASATAHPRSATGSRRTSMALLWTITRPAPLIGRVEGRPPGHRDRDDSTRGPRSIARYPPTASARRRLRDRPRGQAHAALEPAAVCRTGHLPGRLTVAEHPTAAPQVGTRVTVVKETIRRRGPDSFITRPPHPDRGSRSAAQLGDEPEQPRSVRISGVSSRPKAR